MSGVVRDWLFGSREGERPPSAEVVADVLAKCGLSAAAAAAAAAATTTTTAATPWSGEEQEREREREPARVVEPEPYFCPIEYLYLSEPIIQRHHRAAPLTRRENVHFAVGDLAEVEMEAIPDYGTAALPPGLAPSSSFGSLPAPLASAASSLLQSSSASAAAAHRPPPPPPPSAAATAAFGAPNAAHPRPRPPGPRGGASLLGVTTAQRPSEKPRLKVIKLDEVKVRRVG
jgi:hypothetical protein